MLNQTLKNRYKVTAQLGRGAMGLVYRATDKLTRQEVALKVIAGDLALDTEVLERFRREGEALRQLRHRNIVAFVEMFEHQGQQVIVMEYMGGGNLHRLIQQGTLPLAQAREVALDLCDALICAHRLNIIHRDIKPENVLLAEDGTPKLTDFGVARLMEAGTRLTGSGTQVGTPYYMCPEAWEGKALDVQADVWSLGVVVYEMLAGQVPFGGGTMVAVMNKVLTAPLPDLTALRSDVPPQLAQVVGRALARDKAQRYPTVRQMSAELEQCVLPAPEAAKAEMASASGPLPMTHSLDTPAASHREEPKVPAMAAVPPKRDTTQRPTPRPVPGSDERATQVNVRPAVAPPRQRRTVIYAGAALLAVLCLLALGGLGLWGASRFLTAQPAASAVRPAETPTLTETPAPPMATPLPPATPLPATPVEVTRIVQLVVTVTPEPRKVAYTYKDMVLCFPQLGSESDWRIANTASFKETAQQLGIKQLVFSDAQWKQENQISAMRACIQQGVSVIALPPVVETGWDAVLQEAKDANIPVIVVDRSVSADPSMYAAHIGSDMVTEGRRSAAEFNKMLPNGGNILELSGTTGSDAAVGRAKGFREALNPNIKILDSQTGNFTRAEGKPIMEAFLKKYAGQIQGVFFHNDDMAIGAVEAIKAAGLKPGDLKMVSIDGARSGFQLMIDGWLQADVECSPLLGPQVLDMALKLMNGQAVDKNVLTNETVYYPDKAAELLPTRKY